MDLLLSYTVAALLIVFSMLFIMKAPRTQGLIFLSFLALVVPVVWLIAPNALSFEGFGFIKFYLVFSGAFYFQLVRFKNFEQTYGKLAYAILFVNIFIVVALDLHGSSYVNGLAGVFVLLSMPSYKTVVFDKKENNVFYGTSWIWIIAYSSWNYVFIYGLYPMWVFGPILHLGIPILFCIKNPHLFIQYRAYVLSFMMVVLSFSASEPYLAMVDYTQNEIAYDLIGYLALLFSFIAVVKHFMDKKTFD